jgi:hypothetical protein
MKLKLQGNSIRLQLTRSEVARFAHCGRLEEAYQYGPSPEQRLSYGIESAETDSICVRVNQPGICVVLPKQVAKEWASSERVGVSGEIQHPDGSRVDVLVEKEFRRMHGGKDDPDLYPNPLERS